MPTLSRLRLLAVFTGAVLSATPCWPRHADAAEEARDSSRPPEVVTGRVLLPNGKPAADVAVAAWWQGLLADSRTDAEGTFKLILDAEAMLGKLGDNWRRVPIVAARVGNGAICRTLRDLSPNDSIELQLAEEFPLRGRILDQQGRAVEGASVRLDTVYIGRAGIDGFLKVNRDEPEHAQIYLSREMSGFEADASTFLGGTSAAAPVATTGKDGRFELRGLGPECVASITIRGPGIASAEMYAVTRAELDARWQRGPVSAATRRHLESGGSMPPLFGSNFHYLANPGRDVTGRVTDATTGTPIPGVTIYGYTNVEQKGNATTDADGRYTLAGVEMSGKLRLYVLSPNDKSWLNTSRKFELRADQTAIEADFKLHRGVVVTGRVTEIETGAPVSGWLDYLAWPQNAELPKLSELYDGVRACDTGRDGHYRIVVPPGPGTLSFVAHDRQKYEAAREEDFGFPTTNQEERVFFYSANYGLVQAFHYHVLRRIEPTRTDGSLTMNLGVSSGVPIHGRLLANDGNRLKNIVARGLLDPLSFAELQDPAFAVHGLKPGEKRAVFFNDRHDQYAAVVTFEMPKEGKPEPVTVRMERCATVSGRLLDLQGRPLSRRRVAALSAGAFEQIRSGDKLRRPGSFKFDQAGITDADGYFRLKGIPANISFEILSMMNVDERAATGSKSFRLLHTGTARPGQQLDLGELKIKSENE